MSSRLRSPRRSFVEPTPVQNAGAGQQYWLPRYFAQWRGRTLVVNDKYGYAFSGGQPPAPSAVTDSDFTGTLTESLLRRQSSVRTELRVPHSSRRSHRWWSALERCLTLRRRNYHARLPSLCSTEESRCHAWSRRFLRQSIADRRSPPHQLPGDGLLRRRRPGYPRRPVRPHSAAAPRAPVPTAGPSPQATARSPAIPGGGARTRTFLLCRSSSRPKRPSMTPARLRRWPMRIHLPVRGSSTEGSALSTTGRSISPRSPHPWPWAPPLPSRSPSDLHRCRRSTPLCCPTPARRPSSPFLQDVTSASACAASAWTTPTISITETPRRAPVSPPTLSPVRNRNGRERRRFGKSGSAAPGLPFRDLDNSNQQDIVSSAVVNAITAGGGVWTDQAYQNLRSTLSTPPQTPLQLLASALRLPDGTESRRAFGPAHHIRRAEHAATRAYPRPLLDHVFNAKRPHQPVDRRHASHPEPRLDMDRTRPGWTQPARLHLSG